MTAWKRPFSSVCPTPAASVAIVAECGRYDIPQGSSNTLCSAGLTPIHVSEDHSFVVNPRRSAENSFFMFFASWPLSELSVSA